MATRKSPRELLYEAAKVSAKDSLGGERAYWIAGPSIRRMAVSDALLTNLVLQGADSIPGLLADLFDLLTSDKDFQ